MRIPSQPENLDPGGSPNTPRAGISSSWKRFTSLLFWLAWSGFLIGFIWLAFTNHNPGSPDSCNNLETARNIYRGQGFQSRIVQHLWARESLPHAETVRPPGIPYLVAGAFHVFGMSLAVGVLLNTITVALTTLVLRLTVRIVGPLWYGNVAGLIFLLSFRYEMLSVWSNNLLTLYAALLLWIVARGKTTQGLGMVAAVLFGVLSALAFLMKPPYVFTGVLFPMVALASQTTRPWSRRVAHFGVFLTVFLAVSSPYWLRNMTLYGEPLHSPVPALRLAVRYDGDSDSTWRTVRFDRPMTYEELLKRLGWSRVVRHEAHLMIQSVIELSLLNPGVSLLALSAVLFPGSSGWRNPLLLAALAVTPLFEAGIYAQIHPRYLWPVFPALIVMGGIGIRDYQAGPRDGLSEKLRGRARWWFALALGYTLLFGASSRMMNPLYSIGPPPGAKPGTEPPAPGWNAAARALPDEAILLTADPWHVAWWSEKMTVICPVGSREDLLTVLDTYAPTHFLELGIRDDPARDVGFLSEELEPLESGPGWTLYRIVGDSAMEPTAGP
jgi:hypothetical protein